MDMFQETMIMTGMNYDVVEGVRPGGSTGTKNTCQRLTAERGCYGHS